MYARLYIGQFLWMIGDGLGRLGFEMNSIADARFLCRSIDFLVSAVVQHTNIGETKMPRGSAIPSISTTRSDIGVGYTRNNVLTTFFRLNGSSE